MDETQDLAVDILENGLKQPIVLTPNGKYIVDGRNRLTACGIVGVEPRFRKMPKDSTEDEIIRYMISSNVSGLTPGQRAIVGAAYLVTSEKSGISVSPHFREAREIAGELVGVSGKTVQLAKKVLLNRPDLLPAVRSGKRPLNRAYEETMAGLGLRSKPLQPVAPVSNIPAGSDKSRTATLGRVSWLRYLALTEQLTSAAIAKRLGITQETVRKLAKIHGVSLPGDAKTWKKRKGDFSIDRVAQVIADDLVATIDSIDKVQDNFEELDPDKAEEWARIFWRVARKLNRLAKAIHYDSSLKRTDDNNDNDTP